MMDVKVPAGKYVIAVSGGVDSMALLDILARQKKVRLIVAHFDHGIREDSREDAKFVEKIAKNYGLEFETARIELGPGASEEEARRARYDFLRKVRDKYRADKIITAHHQDDLIETAFLNILRGTSPRGLVAIQTNPDISRPLLNSPKAKIMDYAQTHRLRWRNDPSNASTEYLRNYVRQMIMPKLSTDEREQVLKNVDKIAKQEGAKNKLIEKISQNVLKGNKIDRLTFIMLPTEVSREVMSDWLRAKGIEVDRKLVERLVVAVKVAAPGSTHHIKGKARLLVEKDFAILT